MVKVVEDVGQKVLTAPSAEESASASSCPPSSTESAEPEAVAEPEQEPTELSILDEQRDMLNELTDALGSPTNVSAAFPEGKPVDWDDEKQGEFPTSQSTQNQHEFLYAKKLATKVQHATCPLSHNNVHCKEQLAEAVGACAFTYNDSTAVEGKAICFGAAHPIVPLPATFMLPRVDEKGQKLGQDKAVKSLFDPVTGATSYEHGMLLLHFTGTEWLLR